MVRATAVGKNPPGQGSTGSGTFTWVRGEPPPMAETYRGLVGAFGFALRESRSWLLRSYVVTSAAVGIYVTLLVVLALVTWIANPIAFGERAFLMLLGLLVVMPLFAPVLVVARRYRRADPPTVGDRWLALSGYGFLAALVLGLFISDPAPHAASGALAPAVAWLDGLPDGWGLAPPAGAAVAIVIAVRLTRPTGSR